MKKSFSIALFLSVISAIAVTCVCIVLCGKIDNGRGVDEPDGSTLMISDSMTAYLGQTVTLTPYLVDENGKFVRGEYKYSSDSECLQLRSDGEGVFTVTEYSAVPQKITVTETATGLNKDVTVSIVRGELLDVAGTLIEESVASANDDLALDFGVEFSFAVLSIPQNVPIAPFFKYTVTDKNGKEIADAFDVRLENTVAYFTPACIGEGTLKVVVENASGSVRREYEYEFMSAMRDGAVNSALVDALDKNTLCGKSDIANITRLAVRADDSMLDVTGMNRLSLNALLLENTSVITVSDGVLPDCDIYVGDELLASYADGEFADEFYRIYPKTAYDENKPCIVYESGTTEIPLESILIIHTTELKELSLSGCGFVGWKDRDGKDVTYDGIAQAGKNIHVYAKWNPNAYTVTLNYNQATSNIEFTQFDVYFGSPLSELPTPYKDGYEFDGWYSDDATGVFTQERVYNFTSDISLYARWSTAFTLCYDLYDLSSQVKVVYGSPLSLPEDLTFNGWSLVGWYTEVGGKGDAVQNGNAYTGIGGKVLHAKWVRELNVEYEGAIINTSKCPTHMSVVFGLPLNLHEGYVENPTGSESGLVTLPKNEVGTMALEGWQFLGWYTERAGHGIRITTNDPFPDTDTMYAKWSTQITLTDSTINKTFPGIEITIGDIVPFYTKEIMDNMERTGYAFINWAYTSGGSKVNVVEGARVIAEMKSAQFEAVWGASPYEITFNTAVTSSSPKKRVSYESVIGALDSFVPSVAKLKFVGWFYENQQITASTVYRWNKNITVTAKWEGYYTSLASGQYTSTVNGVEITEHTFDFSALGNSSAVVSVSVADSTSKITVIGNKNSEYNLSFSVSSSRTAPITLVLKDVKLKSNLYLGNKNAATLTANGSVTITATKDDTAIISGPLTVNGSGFLSVIGKNGSVGRGGQIALMCNSLEIASTLSGYSFVGGKGGNASGYGIAGCNGGEAALCGASATLYAPGSFVGGNGGDGSDGMAGSGSVGGKGGNGGVGLYVNKLNVYAVTQISGGAGGNGGNGGSGVAGSKGSGSQNGTNGNTGGRGGAGGNGGAALSAASSDQKTAISGSSRVMATDGNGGNGGTGGTGGKGGAGGDGHANWFFNAGAYDGKPAGNGGNGGQGGAAGNAGNVSGAYTVSGSVGVQVTSGTRGKTGNGGYGGDGGDAGSDSKSGAYSKSGGAAGKGGNGGASGSGKAGSAGSGKSGGKGGSDY